MYNILEEFNKTNSTNDKLEIMKKYKDDETVLRVFHLALNKVKYNFGIRKYKEITNHNDTMTLNDAMTIIESKLATRLVTGKSAINLVETIMSSLSKENAYVMERILDRDLKINFGKNGFNKVVSKENKIAPFPYTRCEIGTKSNITKNMPMNKDGNFINKVYSEQKLDGTFRRAIKDGDEIEITSRPGIVSSFPLVESQLKSLPIEGVVFIGEMTLRGEQNRSVGNGKINSDEIPHEDVLYTLWDMIPITEFSMSKDEIKKAEKAGTLSKYEDRLDSLEKLLNIKPLDNVELVEYRIVKNMTEAYEHFQEVTKRGDEGTVIKSHDMTHKDGNSKKQLKVKLVIELDVRITGFSEGNKGSKNENYFAGIEYTNDEGTIKGSVGVTSLTEDLRDWFNERKDELIGDVMTLHCNDITKGRENEHFALSHPRYQELRGKEKETDTLERALEQKQMAMEMKERVR